MFKEVDQPCTEVHTNRFIITEERIEYCSIFRIVMATTKNSFCIRTLWHILFSISLSKSFDNEIENALQPLVRTFCSVETGKQLRIQL